MMDAQYVLCRWKTRLWPAKVLFRTETSTKNKRKKEFFLDVQILSLDEKVKVKSTEVKSLKKSQIEDIASLLASQKEVPAAPLEELAYRRSLRVALDVLNETTSLSQGSSSGEETAAPSQSQKPAEPASSPCVSNLSAFCREDPSDSPGLEGSESGRQSASRSLTRTKGLRCRADLRRVLGKRDSPRALLVSSTRGRSRTLQKNWRNPSKKERHSAEKSSLCENVPSLSEGAPEIEKEKKTGGPTALPSPPAAGQEGTGGQARGDHPVRPAGGLAVLLPWRKRADDACQGTRARPRGACRGAGGCPAKRRCPESRQSAPASGLPTGAARSPSRGPRGHMTLRSASKCDLPLPHAPVDKMGSFRLPDSEKAEEDRLSSGESMDFNSINSILEEDEDEEEPPRILLYHEPRSFEVGMLVWLKYQKYPFWPAVVKSILRRDKKASVLFIEGDMNPKGRGITVSLRRLKHFDCKEKQMLLNEAKESFSQAIGWCMSLITDYRVRLGCGSFAGSFLEYYAAKISYPVRKLIQQDVLGTTFPQLSKRVPEEPVKGSPRGRGRRPCRRILPDRSRAARDRANQKLVEYIVKAKGAESHLRAILRRRKPSRWLKTFLNSSHYVTCVETYLEDEEQLDRVVKYLQGVYREMDSRMLTRINGDRIRFILDVLLPEAIICAISAVDAVDYKTAEEKYIKGPLLSYREREIFDNQVLEERNRRRR
ncbi:PWWP domain-containing DNA repair factor 3A [Choloepus didactylus]|uniref:PWWP domain-containing DNA repair factor 3A n=1 Tax=Choloepus didactylus TaxID=27675 RepID=UPI00189F7275|nr:PWWP domain-containing DNA repair factor 3A [Choloepus didactylus]XP_037679768.1 PWWP domain-containing DNA repair factor 3A [Choloepus didactylus]XP_037679769.1 PWWP domain-containing DNA repair factor 3A [Choloepus didactylus]XP_037679770.1 PWWP domain-containing DNA repair factor 3A [Choloepus didactylus]XP_037679771.1 PWWP domain-containing DNA repair factor 3A [Choloepus didactylus]XP_037679772.1 PWWP domain-containing DNA repair factor 3A [Choloepus didactylus]XP_037679773.1 PWWP dom